MASNYDRERLSPAHVLYRRQSLIESNQRLRMFKFMKRKGFGDVAIALLSARKLHPAGECYAPGDCRVYPLLMEGFSTHAAWCSVEGLNAVLLNERIVHVLKSIVREHELHHRELRLALNRPIPRRGTPVRVPNPEEEDEGVVLDEPPRPESPTVIEWYQEIEQLPDVLWPGKIPLTDALERLQVLHRNGCAAKGTCDLDVVCQETREWLELTDGAPWQDPEQYREVCKRLFGVWRMHWDFYGKYFP